MPTVDEFRAHLKERLTECRVPENLHGGLIEYFAARRKPGSFLSAVLVNDLRDAVLRADDESRIRLGSIVMFVVSYTPAIASGSPERFEAWLRDDTPVPLLFE